MAKKIVIASGKGGVGKSTTAAMLGLRLARLGKRTLLVDCDAGLNTLHFLLETQTQTPYHWLDAAEGACDAADTICTVNPCLSLINAPTDVPAECAEDCIRTVLSAIEDRFDFILLDAPAGLGTGLKRAALPADSALIIATADAVSVQGAGKTQEILQTYGVGETRLIVNRYDTKAAKKGSYFDLDTMIDQTLVQLIGVVPEDPALSAYSVTHRLGKKSKSLPAFERIARRMQGENVRLTHSLLK